MGDPNEWASDNESGRPVDTRQGYEMERQRSKVSYGSEKVYAFFLWMNAHGPNLS